MQLVDIILDNRISCPFINASGVENVIFCRPLQESLDNISLITTKDSEFIHSYIEESAGNYLITSVVLDDGTVYEGVRFKLVTVEEGKELPASTIDLSSLGAPSATDVLPSVGLIEEEYNQIPEVIEEKDDFSILYDVPEVIDNTEIVQKVKVLENKLVVEQQKLEQDRAKLNKERTILEADRKLQKTLEDYKSELLQETYLINEHQKSLLEKAVSDLNNSLQEQFDGQQINVNKYLDALGQSNLLEVKKYQDEQIESVKGEINNLLTERLKNNSADTDKLLIERAATLEALFTEKLITELEAHKRDVNGELTAITNTLDGIVNERLKENNDEVDKLLVTRAGMLQEQVTESVTGQLDQHKTDLFNEFKTVSTNTATELFEARTKELNTALELVIDEHRKNLNTTIDQKLNEVSSSVSKFTTDIEGKLPQLDETIKDINKRIQTLVIEKKNVQALADDARKYTDTKVAQASEEMMNYARRILDLGGGGGSVAVQYANGGTMDGSLNVTGQYLSGGVDISTLFGHGGGAANATFSPYVTGSGIGAILPLSGFNSASGNYSTVSGGYENTASGNYTTVAGGVSGVAFGYLSFVGGGFYNRTLGTGTAVVGGYNNTASGTYSTVVGGLSSLASNEFSFVGGGRSNCATGKRSTVSGGYYNTASSYYTTVAGGNGNLASGYTSVVAGGFANTASNGYTSVVGGEGNCATGYASFTGGGYSNCSEAAGAVVAGGYVNTASGIYSNVGGGKNNTALGTSSVVAGGQGNTSSGNCSSILGGYNNNDSGCSNVFILGSNISATQANTTFVNAIISPVYCGINTSSITGGGGAGCITLNGGTGTGNTNGYAGCIILDGGSGNNGQGGNGGSILMYGQSTGDNATSGNSGNICLYGGCVQGTQTSSGYSANGGNVISIGGTVSDSNTSCNASGGTLNMSGGLNVPGGYINTSAGGGYISTKGCCGSIGGYIDTSAGTCSNYGAGGSGGCFIARGGWNGYGFGGGSAGYINISGGSNTDFTTGGGGAGGCIILGGGDSGQGNGSYLAGNAGGIISNGSIYYSSLGQTSANGGTLNMSGGVGVDGGSINTSNGGGSIDTRGTGSIGLGNCYTNQQTKLEGTVSSGYNQTLYFPDTNGVGGTIALSRIGQNGVFSGYDNTATCIYSFVGGGQGNAASGILSVVAGGITNNASGTYASILGGSINTASGYGSSVVNGRNNNASGRFSSILAGSYNDTNNKANTFMLGTSLTAVSANYTYVNNLSSQGTLAASAITINQIPTTFINPATASGTFLTININGVNKAIQLWDYTS